MTNRVKKVGDFSAKQEETQQAFEVIKGLIEAMQEAPVNSSGGDDAFWEEAANHRDRLALDLLKKEALVNCPTTERTIEAYRKKRKDSR